VPILRLVPSVWACLPDLSFSCYGGALGHKASKPLLHLALRIGCGLCVST